MITTHAVGLATYVAKFAGVAFGYRDLDSENEIKGRVHAPGIKHVDVL